MPIRKSRVSGIVASGTTADRPLNPSIGDTFFNGTLGVQEIYTSSGWLPATGANDFNVVITGSETSVTLDKEYFAGAYTITSALSDNTFDVYLFGTSNNSAGYSNSPSINATANFNKIVVYGGTAGDLLSFSYKTTFTTSASTTDTFAAPYITSINVADLPNIDDTTTITGGNFDTDIEVWFDGQNNYSEQAKSIVYGSSTSVVATRPDNLLEDNSPYTVRVINPGTTNPSGSNKNKLVDSVTAGGDPVWSTPAGQLDGGAIGSAYSTTVQATDPDGGAITYSVSSGFLPSGLSINSSTGEISGTPTDLGNSFIISATDSGGNITNRSFNIPITSVYGGDTSVANGYTYHTFTSSGTLEVLANKTVDILVVAGGGAGGVGDGIINSSLAGAGGGAGGYQSFTSQSLSPNSYAVAVGAGGPSINLTARVSGPNGNNSQFGTLSASIGGGGGASRTDPQATNPGNGGSGGGGLLQTGGGQRTVGQGNNGGIGADGSGWAGGGGGAGAEGSSASAGGHGGAGLQWLNGSYYAGGGGRGKPSGTTPGNGGIGGGGSGVDGTAAQSGTANSGGGGGGGRAAPDGGGSSGAGGSGIVIVRYPV